MLDILKRYWYFILILMILIHFLEFYLIKSSIRISDALEHAESEGMIRNLKEKEYVFEAILGCIITLEVLFLLFVSILFIPSIFQKLRLNKK
ncbi:hypothetical protein D1632_04610 [Chryseobacterium nematophagum]|uniref:Uncharacterized protein n=1 Tax=Chryseobacterium nematophagum TaxID=2305228 RepID=A0A3M7LFY1_9FLAO|nr:hypothetical protein D1632_04610 [Chryseobacterium nematophagum]